MPPPDDIRSPSRSPFCQNNASPRVTIELTCSTTSGSLPGGGNVDERNSPLSPLNRGWKTAEDGSAREIFLVVQSSSHKRFPRRQPLYRAPSAPLSPVPPCTIHPRPFHDSIEKQSAHVSSYLDRTVPAWQRRQSYSMRPVGKNGPCCVLRDYHPPKRAFVAGYGERGSCAISAVRMPHTRDPFRRRFEYPAGNNEGPLFRWFSLVLLFIFLSAIKHCTGGAISICPPPRTPTWHLPVSCWPYRAFSSFATAMLCRVVRGFFRGGRSGWCLRMGSGVWNGGRECLCRIEILTLTRKLGSIWSEAGDGILFSYF